MRRIVTFQMFGNDQFIQKMWEYFCLFRFKATKFLEDAKMEKQEGIQGQWQQESLAKEVLDQVRRCADTDCSKEKRRLGGVQKELSMLK